MIPQGIEVLVKKASVDEEFRGILLEQREGAAGEIALELADSEKLMLQSIPRTQLEAIIRETKVAPENRRVFLGKVAAAMLAAVSVGVAGCEKKPPASRGVQPDKPPDKSSDRPPARTLGISPDRPPSQKE